jgi:hypothetical protein
MLCRMPAESVQKDEARGASEADVVAEEAEEGEEGKGGISPTVTQRSRAHVMTAHGDWACIIHLHARPSDIVGVAYDLIGQEQDRIQDCRWDLALLHQLRRINLNVYQPRGIRPRVVRGVTYGCMQWMNVGTRTSKGY